MDIYTATEAARTLQISLEMMTRYCRQGRLPGSQRKGRCWLIPGPALERFRAAHAGYRRGRPARPDPSVFWREPIPPAAAARAQILATRDPSAMPQWVSARAARQFARDGRTRLERLVRAAMVEELYGPRP
ncbi:helix-turn-helix domain-containing protein [bacterium]|nr:helix-turn-helix domain-containing protein [bacterium]